MHTADKGLCIFPQLVPVLHFSTCMKSQYLHLKRAWRLDYLLCKCVLNMCAQEKSEEEGFLKLFFYAVCRCFRLVSMYVQMCPDAKIEAPL